MNNLTGKDAKDDDKVAKKAEKLKAKEDEKAAKKAERQKVSPKQRDRKPRDRPAGMRAQNPRTDIKSRNPADTQNDHSCGIPTPLEWSF